jgi:hypothetical protein
LPSNCINKLRSNILKSDSETGLVVIGIFFYS